MINKSKLLIGLNLSLTFLISISSMAAQVVRIGTSATVFPYSYTCPTQSGVCGAEADLFNRICQEQNMNCIWVVAPWATSPQNGPMGEGGMLFDLLNPQADGTYKYDAVINSVSASPERRLKMLFSMNYYTAQHIFITNLKKTPIKKSDLDKYGYILDQSYFVDKTKKLKIGTPPGFLFDVIHQFYANAKYIEVVATTSGDADLVQEKIDVMFGWTGVDKKITEILAPNLGFGILSFVKTVEPDLQQGVAVATRISAEGRALSEVFSKGILDSRKINGGYHRQIFTRYLGLDLWPCRTNPALSGDPKCLEQPK